MLLNFLEAFWALFLEMAPWLWLGFLTGGILHLFLKPETLQKYLKGNAFTSTAKASLLGVPLPLCSCSIIPVAAQMHRGGMSKGATLSFLSSTPTTGVDSFLATWSLLGPLFAGLRAIYSLISGTLAGFLLEKSEPNIITINTETKNHITHPRLTFSQKISSIWKYTLYDLIRDVTPLLLIGLGLGALMEVILPAGLLEQYLQPIWIGYLAAILLGLPLYVCATGSLPIGLALFHKGLSAGGVFLFLTLGPATNMATLTFVSQKLGKKALFFYLFSLSSTGLLMAWGIDFLWDGALPGLNPHSHSESLFLHWVSAVSLILAMVWVYRPILSKQSNSVEQTSWTIPSMTCGGCSAKIQRISLQNGVQSFEADLQTKKVTFYGDFDKIALEQILSNEGYAPKTD